MDQSIRVSIRIAQMFENIDEFDKWLAFVKVFPTNLSLNVSPEAQSFVHVSFVKVFPRQNIALYSDCVLYSLKVTSLLIFTNNSLILILVNNSY